jgi:hypothetical protein
MKPGDFPFRHAAGPKWEAKSEVLIKGDRNGCVAQEEFTPSALRPAVCFGSWVSLADKLLAARWCNTTCAASLWGGTEAVEGWFQEWRLHILSSACMLKPHLRGGTIDAKVPACRLQQCHCIDRNRERRPRRWRCLAET